VELVTRVYKFGGGWNRKLLSMDKNLANHEHENAIILDECVYSTVELQSELAMPRLLYIR
jgi:H2-forming N5,N10-methylenetetrahydromethanopterin dehydrogenase-like enzyme